MEHRRRFPKAFRYNVQMEYSRPLGWISRTPEGKFVLDEGFTHHEPAPSSQASLRDSFHSRSSGRSGVASILDGRVTSWWPNRGRTRDHWKEHQPEIQTIYEPRAPRYRVRTSSPGPIAQLHHPLQIEDVSSVLQPSSVERSFPSTVSSHFTPNRLHPSSYELPSLRILHEQLPYVQEEYEPYQRYVQPVPQPQQVRAEVHQEPHPSYYDHPPQPVPVPTRFLHFQPQHHLPMQFALPIQDVHIMDSSRHIQVTPPHIASPIPYDPYKLHEPYFKPPHFPHYVPPPLMHESRQSVRAPRRHMDVYPLPESYLSRNILRPSFSEIDNQRPLATSSPPQGERRSVHVLSSPSSRSGHRESESSSEDRPVTYTRDRLHKTIGRVRSGVLRTERPFRHSAPELIRGPTSYSPATTSTTEEEQVHVTLADPSSRTSVTSASSGHGSKHSRGDSFQGDLEYSPSSSSGFASRNTSQSQPSPYAVVTAPPPSLRPPAQVHTSPSQREPLHHRTQLDISVDENYEFDSISPPESSLLEKLRQYGQPWVSERGMSDSELYTKLYPRPKKPSKYDNIEIERRIPALKEEFQQFRRRQQERRRSEELESEC